MARLQELDSQWGYLLKLQVDRARQEQAELKQQDEMRKRKYKQQLQQMIASSNNHSKSNRAEDSEIMRVMERNAKLQQQSQRQYSQRLHQQKVDFAHENLRSKEQHIRKQQEDRARDHKMFQEQYRRQQQDAQFNKQKEQEMKYRQKTQLASAYEHKIMENANEKYRTKEEDVLIAEQSRRLQHNKDRQRKELLERIKYGYHQNPQTFQNYSAILKKKQEDKHNIISKYLKQDINQDYDCLEKQLFSKDNRSSSSTGHSNRMSSSNIAQINKDLEMIQKKTLDPNISQEEFDRLRQLEKKVEFRKVLQKQIDQRNLQKLSEKRMDNIEVRINKQAFVGQMLLPGIATNDYHKLRQREIINNSMGVHTRLRTLEETTPRHDLNFS